ncbi:MAG TPA: hypothetical protein VFX60_12925 [Micromonospora sp.]|nr:hypothetical protein [Micromonospora sp.]
MRVEEVDERDSSWEDTNPRFRVYLFEGGDEATWSSWRVATYDIEGVDILEVIRWAQTQAGEERLYAVALVGEREAAPPGFRRGLTWLVGMDANEADAARNPAFVAMQARRGKKIVNGGTGTREV